MNKAHRSVRNGTRAGAVLICALAPALALADVRSGTAFNGTGSEVCSTTQTGAAITNATVWTCLIPNGNGGFAMVSNVPTKAGTGYPDLATLNTLYASGANAIVIGTATSKAAGSQAVAIGAGAVAMGTSDVYLGDQAGVGGAAGNVGNVGVGLKAGQNVTGAANVAIGTNAGQTVTGSNNIATGSAAGNVVAGDLNNASGAYAGQNVTGNYNFAAGNTAGNTVTGSSNSAVGDNSGRRVQGNSNVASGNTAGNDVAGNNNIASGFQVGQNVTGSNNIALGRRAGNAVTASNTVSIGNTALASSANAIAIGMNAVASGSSTISIGTGNQVSGANSGAIGDPSSITGSGSYALGNNNTIAANNAFVIGNSVTIASGLDGSVALGHASAVAASNPTASTTINGTTYSFAGATPTSVVSIGGVGSERQLTNVAAGRVSASSTDAVNGSQLFATNQSVAAATSAVATLNATVGNIAGDTSGSYTTANGTGIRYARTNESTLAASDAFARGIGSTALGYNASTAANATNALALGNSASVSGAGNVALGANAIANGAGLSAAAYAPAGATAAIAGTAPVGEVSIGSVGNERRVTNVAAGAAATDAVNVSQLQAVDSKIGAIAAVAGNAVQYDNPAKTGVTLAGAVSTDGGLTNGTKIGNLAQGAVNATSTDAVNGAQLFGVQQQISSIAGGNVKYFHTNSTAADSSALGADSIAIGPQATASSAGSVALGSGANASQAGSVALGANAVANRGAESYVGAYSNAQNNSVGTVSVGAIGAQRTISNVADAKLATDAVNLRQLNGAVAESNAYTDSQITSLQTAGQFVVSNPQALAKATSGTNAVAGGAGAVASGASSVALGNAATASAANAVALGAGSVADRSNTLSVGAAGAERQVTNVAAGTAPTDAVNVGQLNAGMQNTLNEANAYTDGRVNALGSQINNLQRDANAGTAAAMALAGMPQAVLPGKSMAGAAVSTYQGATAVAVGVSGVTENGRWVYKVSGSVDSRGKTGATAGAGFHW